MYSLPFAHRFDAAQQLADKLAAYAHKPNTVIVAIPRGALQIGAVLSERLQLPLDVFFTKKIGYPGNPEYAVGAATLNDYLLDPAFEQQPGMQEYVKEKLAEIRQLLRRRVERYRSDQQPLNVAGKTVILVDDGIATGKTMCMTVNMLKKQQPKKIIVAVPVAPLQVVEQLRQKVDEVICLHTPREFFGVNQFYQTFPQVEDEEAIALLKKAQQ